MKVCFFVSPLMTPDNIRLAPKPHTCRNRQKKRAVVFQQFPTAFQKQSVVSLMLKHVKGADCMVPPLCFMRVERLPYQARSGTFLFCVLERCLIYVQSSDIKSQFFHRGKDDPRPAPDFQKRSAFILWNTSIDELCNHMVPGPKPKVFRLNFGNSLVMRDSVGS